MTDISRRNLIKGAAAVMAIGVGIPAATAAPGIEAATQEAKQWVGQIWKYHIRIVRPSILKTDYEMDERVMVKFLSGDRDTRKFGAQSLEEVNGRILARIPPGAVPWRYIQNRADIPLKFCVKVQRSDLWRRPGTGRLFVVKTPRGIAIVPPHRLRSQERTVAVSRPHSSTPEKP